MASEKSQIKLWNMKIKIFLFHRVSPKRDPLWDPISPERFDSIIRYITKTHYVVSLENQILSNKDELKISKKLAAIVFDDGYKDFLEYALPILKKYNCPSSMYIVTDCVNKQAPPWTYILDYHFLNSEKLEIKLNIDLLPKALQINTFSNLNSKLSFAKDFKLYLKKIVNSKRVQLYQQAIESFNDVNIPSDLMLSWNDLKQIKKESVEIGSHTVTHPLLAQLEDESEITEEIKGSGIIIQQQLGHFPKTISYPVGSYNGLVKKIAKESGYKLGLAVNQTFYNSNTSDIFEIPRVELYNQNFIKMNLRIAGIASTINNWTKK